MSDTNQPSDKFKKAMDSLQETLKVVESKIFDQLYEKAFNDAIGYLADEGFVTVYEENGQTFVRLRSEEEIEAEIAEIEES